MIIYIRKRDKEMCRIIEQVATPWGDRITLRYEDAERARRSGDWFVSREQFERLYKPWIDTDDIGDDKRGEGE